MKIIDLTHTIHENMPVYPGTEQPKLTPTNTYEKDGFKETLLQMYTHTGTHIDPPAHLLKGYATLDQMPPERFIGSALVIDCRDMKPNESVTIERILKHGKNALEAEFLLFNFGWDKYWGDDRYFSDYPCLSIEAIDFIISKNKKGVGLDTISIDPVSETKLPRHKKLFATNKTIVIENMTNLEKTENKPFTLVALPLKHINADGSPTRAIAILD